MKRKSRRQFLTSGAVSTAGLFAMRSLPAWALALFGVGNLPANFSRAQPLAASSAAQSSEDWLVQGDSGKVTFRPFAAIGDETYRLYQPVGV
jgi:hypothetical protein